MNAKHAIVKCLYEQGPKAIHEMNIMGHSQTALSARTRELARAGIVEGFRPEGKPWKVWTLVSGQGNLFVGGK